MSRSVKINKATLELKLAFLGGMMPNNKSILYPLTTEWKEKEVTYSDADKETTWGYDFNGIFGTDITGGGDFDTNYRITSSDHLMKDSWITFDVTDIVKEMLQSPEKYKGFIIGEGFISKNGKAENHDYDTAGSYNNMRYYYSSEFEEKNNRPRLKLDITPASVLKQKAKTNHAVVISSTDNAITLYNRRKETLYLKLFSIQGQTISTITLRARQSKTLNTTNYANGVYLLKYNDKSGSQTKHVVIQ